MNKPAFIGILLSSAIVVAGPIRAQDSFPSKTIQIVAPFAAGLDLVERGVAERLQDQLKVPVIVESREGAGGQIAVNATMSSPPNGYTIMLVVHPPFAVLPYLRKSSTYNPNKLTPIAQAVTISLLLIASKRSPFEKFSQMVTYARDNLGKILHASSGIGTASHLDMERLKLALNIKMHLVPYKGAAQQIEMS
jgi:tripartite-type tricarboxylate transporter receptor subunit TctC